MRKIVNRTVMIIIMAFMLCLVGCGTQEVSLEEHITVDATGYDGYGSVDVNVAKDMINSLVEKEKVEEYIYSVVNNEFALQLLDTSGWYSLLSFEVEGDVGNLSNGDTITINIKASDTMSSFGVTLEDIEEGLDISIKEKVIEIPIDGLEEAKVLDVMSLAEEFVVYSGGNGGGSVDIKIPSDFLYESDGFAIKARGRYFSIYYDHTFLKNISFDFDYENEGKLSEGQTITMHIDSRYSQELGDTGYIINTEKVLEVPDLGEYVVTNEQLKPELKQALYDAIDEELYEKVTSLDKFYWGSLKSTATTNNIEVEGTRLFILVSGVSEWTNKSKQILIEAEVIIELPDGTYHIEVESDYLGEGEGVSNRRYDLEEFVWE